MIRIEYIRSLLTPYLKGAIEIGNNMITLKTPNVFLGIIPYGEKTETIPVTHIASTNTDLKVQSGELILGISVIFASIMAIILLFVSDLSLDITFILIVILVVVVLVVPVSIHWIIDSFEIDLVITTILGKQIKIDFFITDKRQAERAAKAINDAIARRLSDTNSREQTENMIDIIKWIDKK